MLLPISFMLAIVVFVDVCLICINYGMIWIFSISGDNLVTLIQHFLRTYFYLFIIYVGLLYFIGKFLLELALAISYSKMNIIKEIKGDHYYEKRSLLFKSLFANIFGLLFLGSVGYYVQNSFVKFPCILYVCYVLGLACSFPIDDSDMKNSEFHSLKSEIFKKCICNTMIFVLLYTGYYFSGNINYFSNEILN